MIDSAFVGGWFFAGVLLSVVVTFLRDTRR